MTRFLARRVAALLALAAFALPAGATSTGIDYTDQWWGGPSESGWGVNFIEQGTTIFATLFVYGADQTPRWYVATLDSGGTQTFTGPLYSTTGPYFGAGSFDHNAVGVTQVGTMTVVFPSGYNGTLNYTVSGVSVTKSILRQTFKANSIAGSYVGGVTTTASNCHNGATNGAAYFTGGITVTQNGQNVSIAVGFYTSTGAPAVCTYNGVLTPQGVLAQIANGTFSCVVSGTTTNGGTFNADNISMVQSGFMGQFTGSDQYCNYTGYIGGVKAPM
ncbi:MAG TPA: hypothetical protein VLT60_00455 [Usitatibacter sp.]|nr:hypothetical protein [Usitatibacter sp.]